MSWSGDCSLGSSKESNVLLYLAEFLVVPGVEVEVDSAAGEGKGNRADEVADDVDDVGALFDNDGDGCFCEVMVVVLALPLAVAAAATVPRSPNMVYSLERRLV